MRNLTNSAWLLLFVAAAFLAGCGPGTSALPHNEQTVAGVTIDLGVLPAALAQGHPMASNEPGVLSSAASQNPAAHHLVVALFDAKSGARITDARIRAGVGDRSYNHEPDQWLSAMTINGMMTYGAFFAMEGEGPWRIHLEISRPGLAKPIEASFAYEHPEGP